MGRKDDRHLLAYRTEDSGHVRSLARRRRSAGSDGKPGTTQDDVVAALRESGVSVYGCRADRVEAHAGNIRSVLSHRPHLLLDNGASLAQTLLEGSEAHNVIGGTEETTTGANLLREAMPGKVGFPVIVINDSPLKLIMEKGVAAFLSTTNLMIPGKRFAVFGYGSVGGASRAPCTRYTAG